MLTKGQGCLLVILGVVMTTVFVLNVPKGFTVLSAPREFMFDQSISNTKPQIFHTNQEIESLCQLKLGTSNSSLNALINLLDKWKASPVLGCRIKERRFRSLFDFVPLYGQIGISPAMTAHISHWFTGHEELLKLMQNQTLLHITNRWTDSGTILNLLRAKRPKKANAETSMSDKQYIDDLSRKQAKSCDFCNTNYSATDTFGRVYGKYCYTAANIFKLEEWHSLVIFGTHHPIDWSYAELYDSFITANKWFHKAKSISPASVYPHIFWDVLGKSGASQPHPHHHPFLSRHGYYGFFRKWQKAAAQYKQIENRDFFLDLIQTHKDLGLSVQWGTAAAFAAINPKKDYEIVVIAPKVGKDFIDLIYFVSRAYFEDLGHVSLSCGIALPPLDNVQGLPAIARMINRGSVTSKHSDVTSMELFAVSLVETDPYKSFRLLANSIEKRKDKVLMQLPS